MVQRVHGNNFQHNSLTIVSNTYFQDSKFASLLWDSTVPLNANHWKAYVPHFHKCVKDLLFVLFSNLKPGPRFAYICCVGCFRIHRWTSPQKIPELTERVRSEGGWYFTTEHRVSSYIIYWGGSFRIHRWISPQKMPELVRRVGIEGEWYFLVVKQRVSMNFDDSFGSFNGPLIGFAQNFQLSKNKKICFEFEQLTMVLMVHYKQQYLVKIV